MQSFSEKNYRYLLFKVRSILRMYILLTVVPSSMVSDLLPPSPLLTLCQPESGKKKNQINFLYVFTKLSKCKHSIETLLLWTSPQLSFI